MNKRSGWLFNNIPVEGVGIVNQKKPKIKIIGANLATHVPFKKQSIKPLVHILFDGEPIAEAMVFGMELTQDEIRKLME